MLARESALQAGSAAEGRTPPRSRAPPAPQHLDRVVRGAGLTVNVNEPKPRLVERPAGVSRPRPVLVKRRPRLPPLVDPLKHKAASDALATSGACVAELRAQFARRVCLAAQPRRRRRRVVRVDAKLTDEEGNCRQQDRPVVIKDGAKAVAPGTRSPPTG